jgi:uncharacterized protein (TIGR00255 family)
MRSMTGFGQGDASAVGISARVELSAVNRKQVDLRLVLPRELAGLEPRLRRQVQDKLARGACTATVMYELSPERRAALVTVDPAVVAGVVQNLRELARQSGLRDELRLADVLQIPGLLGETQTGLVSDDMADVILAAFGKALVALQLMQDGEGAALQRDLTARGTRLGELVHAIRQAAEGVTRQLRDRLLERIRQLGLELPIDDERLAKEVAFLVDRSDISEEITRLESHLTQFAEKLAHPGQIGRALDFLCLELGREINTLSAKAAGTEIITLALEFKTELERVREQVQNVE